MGLGWEPRPPLPWRRVSAYIAALAQLLYLLLIFFFIETIIDSVTK